MKKIIMLCSVLIALTLIVTMFTACGDKPEEETTTTTTASADNQSATIDETGFTAVIGDTEAVVKKDGKEFQTLKYPNNPNVVFDKAYAENHYEFLDMNFDGQPDFYIAINAIDGDVSYYCWLYNATTNQFDYSIILSALKNISVDASNHRVLSTSKSSGSQVVFSYHWVDGDLVLEKKYDSSSVPEEITKVVEENAIGTDKPTNAPSDSKETTSKTNKPDNKPDNNESNTTTKVNKPANTTTTNPNLGGGVMLGTGDMDEGWY